MNKAIGILLVTNLLIYLLMWWLPVYRRNDSFFAVQIKDEMYERLKHRYLRPFRMLIAAIALVNIVLYVLLSSRQSEFLTLLLNLFPVAAIVVIMIFYGYLNQKVKPFEFIGTEPNSPIGANLTRPDLRLFCIPLELIFWLIVAFAAILDFRYYSLIPDQIPIHWNIHGLADGYITKTPLNILKPLFYLVAMWLLFTFLELKMTKSKNSLPSENSARFLELKQQITTNYFRLFDAIKIMFALIFAGITIIPVALVSFPGLDPATLILTLSSVTTLIVIIALIIVIVKNSMVYKQLRLEFGSANPGYRNEAPYWKWGLFYINPADPAIWVERRDGMGFTLNFAHTQSWFLLAGIIAIPLLLTFIFK